MADVLAFASTANYFAERAGKARDPANRARLLEAASFYRSLARVANESIINDPKYWSSRAEEMRRDAALLGDNEDKHALLCIAEDYNRLAERAEPRPRSKLREALRLGFW